MDYQLAKRLKDAGFPQGKPKEAFVGYLLPEGQKVHLQFKEEWIPADAVYAPSLEELIEEVDENTPHDGFKALTTDGYGWDAEANSGVEGSGQTPEEAVARLWLALNPHVSVQEVLPRVEPTQQGT